MLAQNKGLVDKQVRNFVQVQGLKLKPDTEIGQNRMFFKGVKDKEN